ncbi:hypothetical protein OE88DRAFT_1732992 [Heliocybe sulcata]|uniref:BTB domain-containing protein n=1 Tax=Heliocybe sulcata TaxID=5364 RepID=A0A5C3NAH1_9AGAM|nr:hypothetical protein OE88DRAFT_1732992 [Heliocybe sulcata]
MRQTLETSIYSASFTDTRFFAFSRRHQRLGRIDTPVPLFANSSILKAATYYDTLFSVGFSESSLSALDNKFPENESPAIDINDYGYDSDSDLSDYDETAPSENEDDVPSQQESNESPVQGDVGEPREQPGAISAGKLGRTVIVKDAALRTYTALIFYLYTGEITFRSLTSSQREPSANAESSRSCSPKSMYRLADKLGVEELKRLAFEALKANLGETNIVQEAFSKFTATPGFEEIRSMELGILRQACRSTKVQSDLPQMMRRAVRGELPHAEEMVDSLIRRIIA